MQKANETWSACINIQDRNYKWIIKLITPLLVCLWKLVACILKTELQILQ